jgi:hypothetical protein
MPDNPWEHIFIASASVRTSLRSVAGERQKKEEEKIKLY